MSQTVLTRQVPAVAALQKVQEAIQNPGAPVPIPKPSSDVSSITR